MRVLILSRRLGPEWSADVERLRALERWIADAGYDPLVVSPDSRKTSEGGIWPAVVQSTRIAYQASGLSPVGLVVVAGFDPSLLLAARLCRAWHGWPFVVDADANLSGITKGNSARVENPDSCFVDWARRRSLAEAAAVLTTHESPMDGSNEAATSGAGRNGARAVSIRHAVDLNEWRSGRQSRPFRTLWNCRDRFVCGVPGGPVASTHAQMVLSAAEQLSNQHRDEIQFWVVPDAESSVSWEQSVARRRLGNVRVVGRPPRATLPSLVASCDAWLCSPSQVSGSRLSGDVLSILALNVPVLAPARGPIVDQILDADAGLGVVPDCAESLLDGLDELHQFPEACRGGRQHVAEHHDAEHIAADWERLMQEVGLPVRLSMGRRPAGVRPASAARGDREAA